MPRRQSFSQFLIGSADLDRPSFFYAYSGMWLHLLISVPVLIFFASVPILDALSSMAISSLSLGTIVYSILTREYGLLINLVSYGMSMARAIDADLLGYGFLIVAVIVATSSGYMLLSSEYRRYTQEVYDGDEAGLPLWITVSIGCSLMALFLYGIYLL